LVERVLARRTQLLGAENEWTLFSLQQVADARRELGDLDGAEALLRQGKSTLARLAAAAGLSPDAPPPEMMDEWTEMNKTLAQVYRDANKLNSAKLIMEAALATLAAMPSSDVTTGCVTRLSVDFADILDRLGDLLAAEKLYRALLPKVKGTGNHGPVAHNLGMVLLQRGLMTESRKYLNIAQDVMSKGRGAENSDTQKSRLACSELQTSLRTCAQCGPVADVDLLMMTCKGCKAVRYCSPACAKLHWKAHKKECRRIEAENKQVAEGRADGAGPSSA